MSVALIRPAADVVALAMVTAPVAPLTLVTGAVWSAVSAFPRLVWTAVARSVFGMPPDGFTYAPRSAAVVVSGSAPTSSASRTTVPVWPLTESTEPPPETVVHATS